MEVTAGTITLPPTAKIVVVVPRFCSHPCRNSKDGAAPIEDGAERLEYPHPLSERLQSRLLGAVDFEEVHDPSQLQQGLHPLMYVDQLHLAAHLPDDAVAAGQFAQAIAVYEVHAGEIDQELPAPIAGEDVDKVAQPGAAVVQRHPSDNINHHDATDFSGLNLNCHIGLPRTLSRPESYARLRVLSSQV